MNKPLEDVMVVCNFINPFYGNITTIRKLYQFKHIVFYGDQLYDAPVDVIRYNQSSGLAKKNSPFQGGMFAYRALLDAVERFPGYRGYLFLMDDCFIRPHLLNDLSRLKIWHSPASAGFPVDDILQSPAGRWSWWKSKYGIPACSRFELETPLPIREKLTSTTTSKIHYRRGMADCFYVPENMLGDILAVLDAFSNARVFLEIAVPTTLMLTPESHRELLDIDFLWGKNRGLQPTIASLLGCKHGMHPLKMSNSDYTQYFQPIAESRLFPSSE